MRDVLVQDERVALAEPLDDLRVGLDHAHATPGAAGAQTVAPVEASVVVHRHDHGDVEVHGGEVVIDAVARSRVDDARAVVERDVVGIDELALFALVGKDGLLIPVAGEVLTRAAPDVAILLPGKLPALVAEPRAAALDEGLCHDLAAAVHDDRHVVGLGMQDDGVIGRKRPRRRRPDVHPEPALVGLQSHRHRRHLEAHEDGWRDLVGVLDLGLGQGGVAVAAPVNGLAAPVDGAPVEDGLEDLYVGGVIVVGIGKVGVVPLAKDAEALEALALGVDLLDGELAAQRADLLGGELVEAIATEGLFDLVLDGLPVAVPTRHVGRLVAAHGPVAVDDVLGDLVLRVPQVDGAVGVGGAVVQHELVVALVLGKHPLVDVVLLPLREAFRLVVGETSAHGKPRLGEVRRVLVPVCHPVVSLLHGHQKGARPSLLGRSAIVGRAPL